MWAATTIWYHLELFFPSWLCASDKLLWSIWHILDPHPCTGSRWTYLPPPTSLQSSDVHLIGRKWGKFHETKTQCDSEYDASKYWKLIALSLNCLRLRLLLSGFHRNPLASLSGATVPSSLRPDDARQGAQRWRLGVPVELSQVW